MAFSASAANAAESGSAIYQDGRAEGPAIQVRLADGPSRFPATSLRCGSCHGVDGTGKREGANRVPPVTGEALAAPRPASAEWTARLPYDDRSLARAVMDGVDSAGRKLSSAMPRYALSDPQLAALTTYLKQLGRAEPPEDGVSATLIRVGTALPLSGPQAPDGAALRQMLDALFARASATGIYCRQLELVVADTEATGATMAVSRLVDDEHVFALVATRLPVDMNGLDPEVPIVGDLGGVAKPPSRRAFRIAAPIADRVAVLLRQAEHCDGPNLRLAVIGEVEAPRDPQDLAPVRVVLNWRDASRPDAAVAAAVAANAQAILALTSRETLTALRLAMMRVGVTVPLLVPGQPDDDAAAGAAMVLPRTGLTGVHAAFVGLAPGQIDETAFRSVMPPGSGGNERSLMLYEAYASAVVFLEAVKQAGRRLDRATLVEALEALRDVRTGVLPPISFGPNRHDGSSGAAVIGFAADGRGTFLTPWQDAETLADLDESCRAAPK